MHPQQSNVPPPIAIPSMAAPVATLVRVFVAWKAFLLVIAAGSSIIGPAYDTSAGLLLAADDVGTRPEPGAMFITRLTSWDAIYFVQAARRGYLFEQEWAFGSGLPTVISSVLKAIRSLGLPSEGSPGLVTEALVGVVLSHASHLVSALVLHRIGRLVLRDQPGIALAAAVLHILSPAGLFLSAPYAESTFSLLSFSGYFVFAKASLAAAATARGGRTARSDLLTVLAGLVFGLATAFRSNGILNGLLFAQDLVLELGWHSPPRVMRLLSLGLGGLCVAAGYVIPQFIAYQTFCMGGSAALLDRPWCGRLVPSIYTFVQQHYWGSGVLFQYWTAANIPLFLLAAPMLYILSKSGSDFMLNPFSVAATVASSPNPTRKASSDGSRNNDDYVRATQIRCMAAVQGLLTILALTSYHVQVITRLSSAYPVWYWWLAKSLRGGGSAARIGKAIVVFMLMYSSVQAVLFSSFLPPA